MPSPLRLLSLLVAFALIAAACGSDGDEDSTGVVDDVTTSDAPEVTTEANDEEPGDETEIEDSEEDVLPEPSPLHDINCDFLVAERTSWLPQIDESEASAANDVPFERSIDELEVGMADRCDLNPDEWVDGAAGTFVDPILCRAEVPADENGENAEHGAWITPDVFVEDADGNIELIPFQEVLEGADTGLDGQNLDWPQFVEIISTLSGVVGLNYVLHPSMNYGFGPSEAPTFPQGDFDFEANDLGSDWSIDIVDTGLSPLLSSEGTNWTSNIRGFGLSEFRPENGETQDLTYGHGTTVASAAADAASEAEIRVANGRVTVSGTIAGFITVDGLRSALGSMAEGSGFAGNRLLSLSLGTYGCDFPRAKDLAEPERPWFFDNGDTSFDSLFVLRSILGIASELDAPSPGCTKLGPYQCVVAAAGNNSSSQPFFPADYPEVVGVGSLDAAGAESPYTNVADIYAHGYQRTLAYPLSTTLTVDLGNGDSEVRKLSGAALVSGSSIAAPAAIECVIRAFESKPAADEALNQAPLELVLPIAELLSNGTCRR